MILALGARGRGFDSRTAPSTFIFFFSPFLERRRVGFGKKNAFTQDRTGDLQIFSLTLSQLSYKGGSGAPPAHDDQNLDAPVARDATNPLPASTPPGVAQR